jgi:hypothetical protein
MAAIYALLTWELIFWGFLAGVGYLFWLYLKREIDERQASHNFLSHWEALTSDKKFVYLSRESKQGIALDQKNEMVYFFASKSYHFSEIRSCSYRWLQTGNAFVVQVKDIDNPELEVFMSKSDALKWEEIFRQYVFRN